MKIKRINRIYEPVHATLNLRVIGGTLTQRHNADSREYTPDRAITPLVIVPKLYVSDPSGITDNGYKPLVNVMWYVLPADVAAAMANNGWLASELSAYLVTPGTSGYSVGADGQLTVSSNTPYLSPKTLVLTAGYYDARTGYVVRLSATALLSTTSVSLPVTLELDKPTSWTFDPVTDSGLRTISASLKVGGSEDYTAAYFWYKRVNDVDTLIGIDDLFYESGQNTSSLVIDPRYLVGAMKIVCKADYVPTGSSVPSSPSAACKVAVTTVIRRYAAYDFDYIIHGGQEVAPGTRFVKAEAVVNANHDVPQSPRDLFCIAWAIRPAVNGADWIPLGFGNSINIPMYAFKQGADIGLSVDELEPLGSMQIGSDDIVMDGEYLTF